MDAALAASITELLGLGGASSDPTAWELAPLAGAEGEIRAEIVDAHLVFDAQVKVPVRGGQVDFNDASVEHVGPDSRMGVSRLGVYVDAPNGRSYLYQFPSTPVQGVEYEQRGALLGPWVSDRGRLQLQAFAEGLLRQGATGAAHGFTGQARQLLARTSVTGFMQLGDAKLRAGGLQATLAGRAEGRNLVRVHAKSVGEGFTLEVPNLLLRDVELQPAAGATLQCDEMAGALALRVFSQGGQLRFELDVAGVQCSGLRLKVAGLATPRR